MQTPNYQFTNAVSRINRQLDFAHYCIYNRYYNNVSIQLKNSLLEIKNEITECCKIYNQDNEYLILNNLKNEVNSLIADCS